MTRDRLDDAIDAVAARLTQVADDDALAARISSSLPDRRVGFGWILTGWAPRLAVLALGAVAVTVVLRSLNTNVPTGVPAEVQTEVQKAVQAGVQTGAQTNDRVNDRVNPRVNDRVNPRANDRVNDRDHEFSLPAIASPDALTVGVLAPASLPVEDALSLAPLEIAELPLTAETISPR